jgi:hypothetical protein
LAVFPSDGEGRVDDFHAVRFHPVSVRES